MNKGATTKVESFAAGGPVLGRTCDFMKTPDQFRENKGNVKNFAKGADAGVCKPPAAKDKSLPAVKPRS